MIGIECGSHDLHQLWTSTYVSTVVDSPSLIHAQLDHSNIIKL